MLLLAMLGLLTWDPVAVGCETGKPLAPPIHHEVRWNVRRIVDWVACDPEEPLMLCPVYTPFVWSEQHTFGNQVDPMEADLAPGS